MKKNRIVYQDWIVGLGYDPASQTPPETSDNTDSEHQKQIIAQVQTAMDQLPPNQREFMVRFHFMGESYKSISIATGKNIHKLESLHRQAVRRLKALLSSYVNKQFGIAVKNASNCPICQSGLSSEIDRLIAERDPKKTWRPIMLILSEQFGLKIKSPQVIIGHEKYH